jgi:carboxypeptidase C (cathepsin A)
MHVSRSTLAALLLAASASLAQQKAEEKPKAPEAAAGKEKETKWDMAEAQPAVTHHELRLPGRTLKYTATAGRLPIRDAFGNTEAQMFYVAYTVDGEAAKRPLTFAFNGGPGSASVWLHLGALGPRKVVLQQPDGFMPAAPYRMIDNPETPLEKTDVVLVDAIGTGFSRPADLEKGKRFWSVKGDVEAFGEFIRAFITRNDRWSSPLFLLGESYGTTRAAGVAGYLTDRGIVFNGVALLSMVLDFQTIRFAKKNDEPFLLTLPTYALIANYHKKLQPQRTDLAALRAEAEKWVWEVYAPALAKGDALGADERRAVIDGLARLTGLRRELIDEENLRIDVRTFTSQLLLDQRLKVGRLDGRYSGPDPDGGRDNFFDPTSAQTRPPYTSVLNDYLRRELNYRTDQPYYVSAGDLAVPAAAPGAPPAEGFKWEWGSAVDGWPETASGLRSAMARNPYLKILVLEGYYDLATPYLAANYTMDHLNLPADYRKNVSYATYDAGHMMYVQAGAASKLRRDLDAFYDSALPKAP